MCSLLLCGKIANYLSLTHKKNKALTKRKRTKSASYRL